MRSVLVAAFGLILGCHTATATSIDLAITHARVIDGTGNPAYTANLHIDDGKIVGIDTSLAIPFDASRVIDAQGSVVSPGFIDLHAHGNPQTHGALRNFLAMGVTTITLGQDGSSPMTEDLHQWAADTHKAGIATNVVMFVGHGTLRKLVGIGQQREISEAQQLHMNRILGQNLDIAFGLSTGLEYSPALYADKGELLALAKITGKHQRLIMSHMRNEDDSAVIASIDELIQQGEYAQVHVSHLKSVYGRGRARAEQILQHLDHARKNGIRITADVYPYNASYTGIAIIFPDWAKTSQQLAEVLPGRRAELEAFIRNKVQSRNGPEATLLGSGPYTGLTLAQVAEKLAKPFEQVVIDDIGPEGASAAYFVMDDTLQSRFIEDPLVAICSDGSPTGYHPRGHGTFAKIIEEYVNRRQSLTLEQAIHKMSGLSAQILGLSERGTVAVGKRADLVIFDPAKVKANASYQNPHQLAEGFDYVFVNGHPALEKGQFSEQRSGLVLRPSVQ